MTRFITNMLYSTTLFTSLGVQAFSEVVKLQKALHALVASEKSAHCLLSVQHPAVFTAGKLTKPQHLLLSQDELKKQNIAFHEVDRGGDITFHGLGQLVFYPIFNMTKLYQDTHRYLRDLEAVVIRALSVFNITAHRLYPAPNSSEKNYTGVWVNDEKICAVGVKFSRWTTMHGLALNVNTNLDYFKMIVPCGIASKRVTSMKQIKGESIPLELVEKEICEAFCDIFGFTLRTKSHAELLTYIDKLSHCKT